MPGSFSNYAETKALDHIFGGSQWAVPSLYLGYFISSANDAGPGAEPSGNGYARVAVPPNSWLSSSSQFVQNVVDIMMPRATGNHGTVVGLGLFDSSVGGNFLAFFPVVSSLLIENRDSLVVLNGGLVHQFTTGGFTNFLKNGILNHVYNGVPLPVEASLHFGYMTSAPSDSVAGTEPATGGYSRQVVANNGTSFAPTGGGVKQTSISIEFPIATALQGSITHFGIWNASSGGQFMAYGALDVAKTVDVNDQLIFLAGDIDIMVD